MSRVKFAPILVFLLVCLMGAGCSHPPAAQIRQGEARVKPANPVDSRPRDLGPYDLNPICKGSRVMVLLYHDVRPVSSGSNVIYDITPDEFARQMHVLSEQGANVITIDQLYEHLAEGLPVPDRAVAITFDDNYLGVWRYAVPILDKYGFPASEFVHTSFVGNELVGRPKMTWEQLHALVKDHRFTVESHTATHPLHISHCEFGRVRYELLKSRDVLNQQFGKPPRFLAWPGGNFDPYCLLEAHNAGYEMAFGMQSGLAEDSAGMMQVKRVPFYRFDEGWEMLTGNRAPVAAYATSVRTRARPVTLQIGNLSSGLVVTVGGELTLRRTESTPGEINADTLFSNPLPSPVVGPTLCFDERAATPSEANASGSEQRPIVLWDEDQFTFLPWNVNILNDDFPIRRNMPRMRFCFVAEAWLVHHGQDATPTGLAKSGASNPAAKQIRSFLGVRANGNSIVGTSTVPVTLAEFMTLIKATHCKEAVLVPSDQHYDRETGTFKGSPPAGQRVWLQVRPFLLPKHPEEPEP